MSQKLITPSDFDCLDVAKQCGFDRLKPFVEECVMADLPCVLYGLYNNVACNPEMYGDLLKGSTFEDCKGKTKVHQGLKKFLVYKSYSNYVMLSGVTDTPSGFVQKLSDASIPVPQKELSVLAKYYSDLAYKFLRSTKEFICANRGNEIYDGYDFTECKKCGCNDKCKTKRKIRFNAIKKKSHKELGNKYYCGVCHDSLDKCQCPEGNHSYSVRW